MAHTSTRKSQKCKPQRRCGCHCNRYVWTAASFFEGVARARARAACSCGVWVEGGGVRLGCGVVGLLGWVGPSEPWGMVSLWKCARLRTQPPGLRFPVANHTPGRFFLISGP